VRCGFQSTRRLSKLKHSCTYIVIYREAEAAQWWASSNRACVIVRPLKKCGGICEGLGGDGASEAGEMSKASETGEASGVSETIEAR